MFFFCLPLVCSLRKGGPDEIKLVEEECGMVLPTPGEGPEGGGFALAVPLPIPFDGMLLIAELNSSTTSLEILFIEMKC